MTSLDNQIEELIKERNAFEAENIALKAQTVQLKEALVMSFNGAWDDGHATIIDATVRAAICSAPDQCLNSVKADAISDFVEGVASMDVKGNKGTNNHEFYKAALRNVYLCGKHTALKLRANND